MRRLTCLIALLFACKGTSTAPLDDGGADPTLDTCNDLASACPLTSGVALEGYIYPRGDLDYYSIDVEAGRANPILRVDLTDAGASTPLRLMYEVLSSDGKSVVGVKTSPTGGSAGLALSGSYAVAAGRYYLLVRDEDNTQADKRNPYRLTATVGDNPDVNEPNDTPAQATALSAVPGGPALSARGWLATEKDRDWFKLVVPGPGRGIVDASLTMPSLAPPSLVAYRMQILAEDPAHPGVEVNMTPVVDQADTLAQNGVNLHSYRSLRPGTYYLVISDKNIPPLSDSRPEAVYTLSLSMKSDDPANDNEEPVTATVVGFGASGATLSGTIDSQGDRDFYKISVPASSANDLLVFDVNPEPAGQDLNLGYVVAVALPTPATNCSYCPLVSLCVGGNSCAYDRVGAHNFAPRGPGLAHDTLRLPAPKVATDYYIGFFDSGEDKYSTKPYFATVSLMANPDPNEVLVDNDVIARATPAGATPAPSPDGGTVSDGGTPADGGTPSTFVLNTGMLSWWEVGKRRADTPADSDKYVFTLSDTTVDTGLTIRWKESASSPYRLGFNVDVPTTGGSLWCQSTFSYGSAAAKSISTPFAGYQVGQLGTTSTYCLCVPKGTPQFYLTLNLANSFTSYSDLPYQVEVDATPGVLQPTCPQADGGVNVCELTPGGTGGCKP